MTSLLSKAALAALIALPLAGCNTTGTSSHAPADSSSFVYARDGIVTHSPQSDHVSLKGDSSKRLLELGKENFRLQNYGLAERYFRKAVARRTDNAGAWAGLAAAYDQLGNFEKADRAYKALVELKGNDARVLNNMGYSYLLRGDYKKARKYLNRAQDSNPGLDQVQGNIHLLEKIART
ncbi:tetratricopeptide repeat protein [Salaquimonas pukyongi]|uniref:tetratricopeptide repeat protein n=1 Tax=Salaquimonas pukyongi TaxID=2712698 RepID=UPI00096BBD36|nr:tetratricopeptide repeat protein [Salaquimonas pukyongi]